MISATGSIPGWQSYRRGNWAAVSQHPDATPLASIGNGLRYRCRARR
ncbi:MAG: hypothetical protein U1F68_15655 [Gammaproteobacteria bacterium]